MTLAIEWDVRHRQTKRIQRGGSNDLCFRAKNCIHLNVHPGFTILGIKVGFKRAYMHVYPDEITSASVPSRYART